MLRVRLGRLRRVVHGVLRVPMRDMRVVRRCFVLASLVVLRGMAMMIGRVLVMLGGLMMVLRCLFRHGLRLLVLWAVGRNYARVHKQGVTSALIDE